MTVRRALRGAAFGLIASALAVPAFAQIPTPCASGQGPFDHLECYKVRTARIKGLTADLTPLQAQFTKQTGCKLVGPVEFCVPVCKDNVQPPASGETQSGPQEIDHLCYKIVCPKNTPQPLTAADQFGSFALTFQKANRLCTPAVKQTTTTTSTTRPLNLCTTTTIPLCGPGPSPHTCPPNFGACPGGQTCETDPTGCSCVGPPPACSDAGVFFCGSGTCPAGQTCQTVCGADGNLSCQCH